MVHIEIPDFCLVLLVGVAGCGKSTFAGKNFVETEVLSSDRCRAIISDDESDQSVSAQGFELLYHITRLRLQNRRFTVVDATSLTEADRQKISGDCQRLPCLFCCFCPQSRA